MSTESHQQSGPITVLDGGMGKELQRIGAPFRQPEWSALALMDDPPSVVRAHQNFVESGADVIIVNSYALVPFHIGEERFAERGAELATLAGRLARQAADETGRPVAVAASLPPLFGSYTPWNFQPDRAPELLRVLVEAQAPFVDLWLVETIASCAEAEAARVALDAAGSDGDRWFSYAVDDTRPLPEAGGTEPVLWSGESLVDAAESARSVGADAVLLNCASPEAISAALPGLVRALADVWGEEHPLPPVGAYANGFPPRPEEYSANEVIYEPRPDLTPASYTEAVRGWVDAGATIVGGCCGIHPEHIAELAQAMKPITAASTED